MIAGLLVMDPTLKVMVVTKENAAAHAFAKHIESLQLPPSLEEKFGRLVGATELEKGPASQSKLDILPGSRNTVLRTKQVIIGCGGGFHQECTQPYSPDARWMSEVDIALNDEGQQYGNLDEASAIARVPRKGLVIWCGDHKQTPGGLRKSDEARAFRRKLMRRPIALRGDTKFLPPHMLFFCLDAAWLNEGSLSGRSPFCQRKLSEESQIHWKSFSAKATILKQTTKKHQPHCSLPESAGAGGCSLFLGRLDQGLVGNAESTHVNRPKGKATLVP